MEIIKLHYAKNYRDLGGIPTLDGRIIKKRMLIRGTTLKKLHKNDVKILKDEYKLSTIIDLRTVREVQDRPDAVLDGVNYIHMPVLNDSKMGLSHEKAVHSFKSLEMMPTMESLYIFMVTDDCKQNLIKILKYILELPEENFSVVFHCSAGKDRTGIIAALLLAFLGVDRKLIVKDYLFTNKVTKAKARLVYLGLFIVKWSHKFSKKIHGYYLAKEDYILSALTSLEKEYGSLENFYMQTLGYTKETMNNIREKFLEPEKSL